MEEMLTTTSTIFLPQEIVMEILSRLPANSLVSSFKFVCKAWCTLIQDPDFIKMHLLNRREGLGGASINGDGAGIYSNNHHSLICKSDKNFFQLYPPFNFEGIPPTEAPKKLDFDFDLDLSVLSISRLVCSCNGLLCLSVIGDENMILLNPSTRRYKISPIQPYIHPKGFRGAWDTYGFGCCYNLTTTNIDEYKVVRIFYFVGHGDHGELSYRSQVDVYCMSSNSWRTVTKIRDYAFSISSNQSGVFVNEALHWVATCCSNKLWGTIASFNIRDEEFGQLPIPLSCQPTADDKSYFQVHEVILMNMKGCLSMILHAHANNRIRMDAAAADLEIWVMKEYGIKESWTKEFVISSGDTDPPRALFDLKLSWECNAYVLKGDHMLIVGLANTKEGRPLPWEGYRKLVLYDINKRKTNGDFKMIGVPDEPNLRIDLVDYIETRVTEIIQHGWRTTLIHDFLKMHRFQSRSRYWRRKNHSLID